jgi:hypothetical protein
MNLLARRAQALIVYKHAYGQTVDPVWLVGALEKMEGVTAHQADQAAAWALHLATNKAEQEGK